MSSAEWIVIALMTVFTLVLVAIPLASASRRKQRSKNGSRSQKPTI
jgi:hypothetical protein